MKDIHTKITPEANANSMANALWAIANMQITKNTNKDEVLALCIAIAKIEIKKWRHNRSWKNQHQTMSAKHADSLKTKSELIVPDC